MTKAYYCVSDRTWVGLGGDYPLPVFYVHGAVPWTELAPSFSVSRDWLPPALHQESVYLSAPGRVFAVWRLMERTLSKIMCITSSSHLCDTARIVFICNSAKQCMSRCPRNKRWGLRKSPVVFRRVQVLCHQYNYGAFGVQPPNSNIPPERHAICQG